MLQLLQLDAPGIALRCISDGCPVQFEGTVDGYPAYWRARYDSFALAIATEPGTDALQVALGDVPGWYDDHRYGEPGGYEAGYMPFPTATRLIHEGVAAFRLARTQGLDKP